MIYTSHYMSPLGDILIASKDNKLIGLWIEGQKYFLYSVNEKIQEKPTDEILVKSNINPLKKAYLLKEEECLKIIQNSKDIFQKAIELGGTTIKSYTSSLGVKGSYQNNLIVHSKKNCLICGSLVKVIKVGGRSTYYCPNCQVENE